MILKMPVLLIGALASMIGASAVVAAEAIAVPSVVRVGATQKVCQLTGETDWETGQATAARTYANFGLDAADLGYPVEHGDKLILLFGDSWPPRHPDGTPAEVPPDDAVGITTRRSPPGDDGKCLEIRINTEQTLPQTFAPAKIVAQPAIKQGFFNVPSGGVSVGGRLIAFFWTGHCSRPHPLLPSPDRPLLRPPADQNCPENNERNSIGRSVMARSSDDAHTFSAPVAMPHGFVYTTAVNTIQQADIPVNQRLGVFIYGVPRYRAAIPYLAFAPLDSVAMIKTWQFFVGRDSVLQPKWIGFGRWQSGDTDDASDDPAAWSPPKEAELFAPASQQERCIGEFSITWNRALGLWLMLYNCRGGIVARTAATPWGLWSPPVTLLGAGDIPGCRLVMKADGCANRRDYWPGNHREGRFVSGGTYAPFVLERYTVAQGNDGAAPVATIFWLVSTWNPYQVLVMRTTLQRELRPRVE